MLKAALSLVLLTLLLAACGGEPPTEQLAVEEAEEAAELIEGITNEEVAPDEIVEAVEIEVPESTLSDILTPEQAELRARLGEADPEFVERIDTLDAEAGPELGQVWDLVDFVAVETCQALDEILQDGVGLLAFDAFVSGFGDEARSFPEGLAMFPEEEDFDQVVVSGQEVYCPTTALQIIEGS